MSPKSRGRSCRVDAAGVAAAAAVEVAGAAVGVATAAGGD